MTQNKTHWYDGWFFDTVIAPNQDQLFGQIKTIIEPQSKVLDVESISFHHRNLSEIPTGKQAYFDYAVMTYVIHEVNEEERINLLKEMAKVSNKVILGDYIVPRPEGYDGFISKTIEFLAGREHYRNYKT